MEFKRVFFENLEIGKLYKITQRLKKLLVIEKGIFVKRTDMFLCFKLIYPITNYVYPYVYLMDNCVFYEMIPKKHKIQEAMELRAFKMIMSSLIPDYS
jgi:hypothetical protein